MKNLILRIPPKFNFWEVYQEDDDEMKRTLTLVVNRSASHPISADNRLVFELLEMKGVKVVIRVGPADLTLEQFEKYGQYAPGTQRVSKTVANRQGYYNMRSALNKISELMKIVSKDDPLYDTLVRKVSHLKTMLSTAEPEKVVTNSQLEESNRHLNELIAMFSKEGDNNAERKPQTPGEDQPGPTASPTSSPTFAGVDERGSD